MARHLFGRSAGLTALVVATLIAPPAARAQGELDGVLLRGGGSSFAAPLFRAWIEGFAATEPKLQIEYDSIGSGEGISRFVTGSLDFAGTDAPLSEKQASQVEGGAKQLPTAAGMIAICYNLPGLDGELRLSRAAYAGIFDGTITKWNDERIVAANPGLALPKQSIAVAVRRDGSGTTFAFTSHLNAIDLRWREAGVGVGTRVDWPGSAMTARGNEGVAGLIAISENSIGYVEYGFAQRLGLQMAVLENKEGAFIAPSLAAGQQVIDTIDGDDATNLVQLTADPGGVGAYPLVNFTWALVNERYADQRKGAAVRAFIGWGLGAGQELSEALGYIRLPATLAAVSEATLNATQ